MLLTLHEGKTSSKFQNEFFEVVYKSLFQLRLAVFCVSMKSHKFSNSWIFDVFHRIAIVVWNNNF